jgi:hypothetical protein
LVAKPGVLEGFGLYVQRFDQVSDEILATAPVPVSPRTVVQENWGSSFLSYGIKPQVGAKVAGTIWELSLEDRERVRDWELIDFGWYQDTTGIAVPNGSQERMQVVTEQLGDGQEVVGAVDGLHYETWLSPVEMFEAVAAKARQEYDARNIV